MSELDLIIARRVYLALRAQGVTDAAARASIAALEQNPSSVANLWFLTYRDRSPLAVDDWLGFRDPDEVTYRFPLHGLQMCTAYAGYVAPSSYITNCAAFAAADLLRRVSIVAYRTRELSRAHPELGFSQNERQLWENDDAWQGTRRAVELALSAFDWAESFTAVNLVLRPTLDDIWLRQLGELARAHGDDETWLLLSNVQLDVQRC